MSAPVYRSSFTTTGGHGIAIERNGSEQFANVFGGTATTASLSCSVQHVSSVYKLTAGDAIRVKTFQVSGASRALANTPFRPTSR